MIAMTAARHPGHYPATCLRGSSPLRHSLS